MSINKLISIKTPILDAIDQLGIDHMQDIPVFTRWASLAEKEIKSYFQFERKVCSIKIEGNIAKLPADAEVVQRAVLGQIDTVDLFNSICTQIPMSSATINASALGTFLIVDMGSGFTSILGSIPHVIQDNKIILNQDMDGKYLTIQYLGHCCDEEGFLKISQNHVAALMWFIIWRYYFRMRRKNSLEYGQMNKAQEEWHRECANARAKDGVPTESEREEMAAMLCDPYIGNSVNVGMRTTLGLGYGY